MWITERLRRFLRLAPASKNPDAEPKKKRGHRRKKGKRPPPGLSHDRTPSSYRSGQLPNRSYDDMGNGHLSRPGEQQFEPSTVPARRPSNYPAVSYKTPSVGSGSAGNSRPEQVPPTSSDVTSTTPATRQTEAPVTAPSPVVLEPKVFGSSPPAAMRPWVLPVEPAVSGIAADQARLGDLDVRAVSIVGAGHRCEEPAKPRQDSYRLGRDRAGRYLIIAVADGMSDSRRSDLGATVAARCAVNTLRGCLDTGADPTADMMKKAFHTSAGAMVAAAKNEGLSEMDVRCALIVAIISTTPDAMSLRRRAWFTTLADVSAWLRHSQSWHPLAGDQKTSELDRNTLHNFLPYHPDRAKTVFHDLEPGATIAVVTDGVGDAFTEVPDAAQWFAQRWESPVSLESFLLDVGFHARGQLDDRTSVTVWCRDGVGSQR